MKAPSAIKGLLLAFPLLFFTHCGSSDKYEVWSESVLGAIGGAIQNTQSVGNAGREIPASTVTCPSLNNSDVSLARCGSLVNEGFTTAAGAYLRRSLLMCQFSNTDAGWWRTYHLTVFPSAGTCASVLGSADGLTTANITAFGLVGTTLTLHYGSGGNDDQQNLRFAQNGDVLFLNSIFDSGWKETRKGGIRVKFQSATERRIFIAGVHAEGYQPFYENVRNPTDLYSDLLNKPRDEVVKVRWDRTLNSQASGDRLYQTNDEASDTYATSDSNLVVNVVGSSVIARTGSVIKVQDNKRLTVGKAEITTDLAYTDPKCCWPTSGELTTTFVSFFNSPSSGGKAFQEEKVTFNGEGCGVATLTQKGGDLGTGGKTRTVQLYHCQ